MWDLVARVSQISLKALAYPPTTWAFTSDHPPTRTWCIDSAMVKPGCSVLSLKCMRISAVEVLKPSSGFGFLLPYPCRHSCTFRVRGSLLSRYISAQVSPYIQISHAELASTLMTSFWLNVLSKDFISQFTYLVRFEWLVVKGGA